VWLWQLLFGLGVVKHFEIFGLSSPRLNLNLQELEQKYYELARSLHPDKNRESNDAQMLTADLNAAYRCLRDPWARAEYFVKSCDLKLDEALPASLADLYFEAQESSDEAPLLAIERRLLDEQKSREKDLAETFQSYDTGHNGPETLRHLKDLIIEHKYAKSMLQDLQSKLKRV
jgi:curved DNA-binding protein CbpA